MLLSAFVIGCGRQAVENKVEEVSQKQAIKQTDEEEVEMPLSPKVKVTVGMKEVVSDSGVLIGMAKGYYEELGIEIESVAFNTGQDMINALGARPAGCRLHRNGIWSFNAMLGAYP